MIQIEGFSARQRALADIIWCLDTKEHVVAFIATLPLEQRLEAQTICEMMILACIDEVDTVTDEVVELLKDIGG
jgi:hypothetical protein